MNTMNKISTTNTRSLSASSLCHEKSLADNQENYIHEATADNTRLAYQKAIRHFEAQGGLLPATEASVAQYLTKNATRLNPRTLALYVTAISHWHRYQQMEDPIKSPNIRKLLKGIQRKHGKPKKKAKALTADHIHRMVHVLNQQDNLHAIRNSAIIQLAYFGALRRSELTNLHVNHLRFESDGILLLIVKSKTDQTGEGIIKAVPYGNVSSPVCAVNAVKKWIERSELTEGALFRGINAWGKLSDTSLHPDTISVILKALAKQCDFDFIENLSSHSFRRGFATSAARSGADFSAIKRQGGWKNDNTVREYIEEGRLFHDNAASQLIEASFDRPPEK